ncbi:TraX family protein [Haloimpatiens sp. FM7315]|uniref:TraX family protein n=1 Tax=Haloimpatiens sp. FM7315 TaxID=3298609 RepID=UPI0035A28996
MRLNSFQLKIFAMILMVLDHISTYIPNMPFWFNMVGRIVAPIFFFLIVEGFFHTRDRKKYAFRLFSWALVMFLGTNVVIRIFIREYQIHNNIFLSLGMSVLLMSVIELSRKNKENKKLYILGIVGLIVIGILSIFTEAGIYGLVMTLIFYFLRDNKSKMTIIYVIVSLLLTVGMGFTAVIEIPDYSIRNLLLDDVQWMMVFAFPFFFMYNGKRGLNTKFTKYLFYIFYPLHIWIIYIVGFYIVGK